MIDMDLDVIRHRDTGVYVDDEDEFAEHAAAMNYPARAWSTGSRPSAPAVLAAVQTDQTPFEGHGHDRVDYPIGRA